MKGKTSAYVDDQNKNFEEKRMKRKLLLAFALLGIVGILFFACANGSTDDPPYIPPPNGSDLRKAIDFECNGFTFETNSNINKSIQGLSVTHNLVINNVYEFVIIKPSQGSGNSTNFTTEKINVTVLNQTSLGNGKVRFELKRSDNGTTFTITFDENGDMIGIQGLSGAKDGYLVPIGDNTINFDGAWIGWDPNGKPNSIIINGNNLSMVADNNDGTFTYQRSVLTFRTEPTSAIITRMDQWNDATNDWDLDINGVNDTYRYEFSSTDPNKLITYWEEKGDYKQEWTRIPTN